MDGIDSYDSLPVAYQNVNFTTLFSVTDFSVPFLPCARL